MCFSKPKAAAAAQQVLPAQAVSAQPVAASASVKSALKNTDKERGSNADLRSDVDTGTPTTPVDTTPNTGEVNLGSKRKRKGIVGLDL